MFRKRQNVVLRLDNGTSSNSDTGLAKVAFITLAAGVGLFFAGKLLANFKKDLATINYDEPEVQQAMALRSALGMLHWYSQINEDEIFSIANQISDFNKVQKRYRALYQTDLINDLQNNLNDTQKYQYFLEIVSVKGDEQQDQTILIIDAGTILYVNKKPFGFPSYPDVIKNSYITGVISENRDFFDALHWTTFDMFTLPSDAAFNKIGVDMVIGAEQGKCKFVTETAFNQIYAQKYTNQMIIK